MTFMCLHISLLTAIKLTSSRISDMLKKKFLGEGGEHGIQIWHVERHIHIKIWKSVIGKESSLTELICHFLFKKTPMVQPPGFVFRPTPDQNEWVILEINTYLQSYRFPFSFLKQHNTTSWRVIRIIHNWHWHENK